jgi:two-component system sensor histidine kinase HydH
MKITVKASSYIAAILIWLLFSALAVFTIGGLRDRARLIRDNENEQILNMLFTSLRGYDDFGSAIESNTELRERIAGFAVYGGDLFPVYQWGKTPPAFDESSLGAKSAKNQNGRYTIPDRGSRTVKFVLQTERMGPQPPPRGASPEVPPRERSPARNEENRRLPPPHQNWFFNTLTEGKYFYIDISHPAYWRTRTLTAVLGALCVLALLALSVYIRHLYIRNIEYRERIEAQKNLVVLGTAAGTLAHEIKNPLLSIRLQTGILAKICPEKGNEEIAIINEEVDRLSSLTYRVNDYLREGRGNPTLFDLRGLLAETGNRLCGRNIIEEGGPKEAMVFADPDRLRSVFENLLRNALESGGPPEQVGISVEKTTAGTKAGGSVTVSVRDRGTGIAEADLARIFDPFFTRKSTGTGIGLSISKRFTEAAGGTITIRNREGGGAEVIVTLPGRSEDIL